MESMSSQMQMANQSNVNVSCSVSLSGLMRSTYLPAHLFFTSSWVNGQRDNDWSICLIKWSEMKFDCCFQVNLKFNYTFSYIFNIIYPFIYSIFISSFCFSFNKRPLIYLPPYIVKWNKLFLLNTKWCHTELRIFIDRFILVCVFAAMIRFG